jgi:phosphate butyryltransferase
MITHFAEILARAVGLPDRRIAVCAAEHQEVLEAVDKARSLGIASSILVGNEAAIRRELAALGMDAADYEIIDVPTAAEAATTAVRLVADGKADILMKGLIDTNILLHAVLDKEHGLRMGKVLSHVALFELHHYDKLLAMTDGGINIAPDVDTKEEIIRNSLQVTRALGIETAKVAVVAAKEKVSPKMQATVDAAELRTRHIEGALVDGPFAIDNAINREAARTKGITSEVAGDCDVLLMPQIESGNVFYKALVFLGHAWVAGIVVGARRPIVLTSRVDTEQAKLLSIALAMLVADTLAREAT